MPQVIHRNVAGLLIVKHPEVFHDVLLAILALFQQVAHQLQEVSQGDRVLSEVEQV